MTKERAHLNLSDDLDISEFLPVKKERNKDTEIKTIEKVAEQSGFKHSRNFSTVFKNAMGMSPSDYRKKDSRSS